MIILCASFILCVALLVGPPIQLLTGGILLLLGFAYLNYNPLEITPTEVELKNPLGMTIKRYPYNQLRIKNGRLYADEKKVRMPMYMLKKEDLDKLNLD